MRVMRFKWAALAVGLGSLCASAQPEEQLAVIAGANLGGSEDEPLRYAETDARRVRDLLVELGEVRSDRAILTLGGGPEDLLQALTEVRGRAAEIQRTGKRIILLVYYSGHGDEDGLHLPRGTLPLAQFRAEMARVPADVRVVFLDACRSAGRGKGVHRGPPFDLAISSDAPRGSVEMRASSAGEAAQESDELSGAVFTHFLLSGMRGAADTDGDGRVTLSELYSYAYRRTLLRSGAGPVLQHPTLTADLSGAGEVIVTRPAKASATIEFPTGPERYLVFAIPSAAVMGEVAGDEASRLGVPPGRFLVARRTDKSTAVATVDLTWGGRQRLSEKDFQPISREELALRGGTIDLRVRRIEPLAGVEFAPGTAQPYAVRAGAVFAWSKGIVGLELEAAYLGGPSSTAGLEGNDHSVTGGPAVALRQFYGLWTVTGTLGLELRYTWQRLTRVDSQRVSEAGFGVTERRAFGSFGPRAGIRVAFPLGNHFTGSIGGWAAGLFRREEGTGSARTVLRPSISLATSVGYAF